SISAENPSAALDDTDRLAAAATEQGHGVSVVAFGEQARLVVQPRDEWDEWTPELREQLSYATSLPALYAERTALLASGESTRPEQLQSLQPRIDRVEAFRDTVAGHHTDIERAMRLALNCGPTDDRRTIYALTDCNFNHGRWRRAWSAAAEAAVPMHLVALDQPIPPEVAAAELSLPPAVRINQGFSAELRLASTVETAARLRVFKDGFAVDDRDVPIAAGDNLFELPGLYFLEKGFHTVEVAFRAADDTELNNNTIRALIVVPGEARVLYVDGDENQIPYLKSALELEGMHVEARPTTGVPQTLSELLSFDAFILSNVPADRLTSRQMQMMRTYVRDFGGGFVMLGGDESFGLGGYFKTPIEEILPVTMPIQKDLLRPSLGIMLVIDKSGSMTGVKIQLAKRAAIATAEVINPQDRIGVVGFDGESRVILELTPAADRATIASHISALTAGGGTFLYPALEDAHARLMDSGARRKHVIVLSDGQTQGFGYEELVGMMAADGITLSAVGIGDGADMQLMESIALAGGGRAYFTNDFFNIPQIFTREALRASRNMLVEGLIVPSVLEDDVALLEIDTDELPLLTGYVATTPKPGAAVIVVSDSGDPILAKWRYGLGRSAAFTSEPKPRWAEDWIQWPDFAKFWSQLVRSVTGEKLGETISVECSHFPDGGGVRLTADIRDSSGNFVTDLDLELSAYGSGGPNRKLLVEHVGPGLFEASLPEIAYGRDEQFAWHVGSANPETHIVPYGFVYSFSPEFRTLGVSEDMVDQIKARELGETMSVGQSRLSVAGAPSVVTVHLWTYLLLAAILLAPFDILCRRLG
ncbi:MAG: vWA domain-containing protein, partial [Planctomycetota bacterium]